MTGTVPFYKNKNPTVGTPYTDVIESSSLGSRSVPRNMGKTKGFRENMKVNET